MFLNSTIKLLDTVAQNFTLKGVYVFVWYCEQLRLIDGKYVAVIEKTWVNRRRQAL